ncbi:12985_t:CDS:2, partial [Funneliformis geosporum]
FDYRLAPQNQFPAALQDALAAYLYLLSPPKDAGFEPLDPKKYLYGWFYSNAGGGLGIALELVIRDAGLPMCAGIIGWPLPSVLSSKYDTTDYVSILLMMASIIFDKNNPCVTQVEIDYKEKAAALSAKIKNKMLNQKFSMIRLIELRECKCMFLLKVAIPYVG